MAKVKINSGCSYKLFLSEKPCSHYSFGFMSTGIINSAESRKNDLLCFQSPSMSKRIMASIQGFPHIQILSLVHCKDCWAMRIGPVKVHSSLMHL